MCIRDSVQYPDTLGRICDYMDFFSRVHATGALCVVAADLMALTVIREPGAFGADICIGNTQRFGVPMGFGGPHAAYMSCTDALKRRMPGRLIGMSIDTQGRPAYRLALQTREQHIRRDKATSNICSNQGLMSLFTAMYLSVTGPQGLREIGMEGYNGAHYLADRLVNTGKFKLTYPDSEFFNEFCLTATGINLNELMDLCVASGVLPGVVIGPDKLLVAVTETRSRADMDLLVELVNRV